MSTINPEGVSGSPPSSAPERAVLEWVQRFVVGLDLCPFAEHSLMSGAIRTVLAPGDAESLLATVVREAERLVASDTSSGATTLILMCQADGSVRVGADFDAYLDLLAMAEDLLEKLGFAGQIQLASFHPDYVFADADKADPANWSNRSPIPLLHLLAEDAVTAAIEHHTDPEGIPERNIQRLRALGLEGITSKLT